MDLSEVLPSLGFGKVPIVLGKCCPFICEKAYRHMLDAVQREKGAFVSAFTSKSQNVFARLPTIFDGRPFTPRQRALAKVFGTGPSFGRDLDWSAPVPSGAGVGTSETDQGFGAPMAKVASPVSVDGKGIVEQLTKVSLGDKDLFTAMDAAAVMFDYLRSLPVRARLPFTSSSLIVVATGPHHPRRRRREPDPAYPRPVQKVHQEEDPPPDRPPPLARTPDAAAPPPHDRKGLAGPGRHPRPARRPVPARRRRRRKGRRPTGAGEGDAQVPAQAPQVVCEVTASAIKSSEGAQNKTAASGQSRQRPWGSVGRPSSGR